MKKNEVTVIVCAYNAQNYILETLEGIASQTWRDFDLLIVNDSSTDDTLGVVNEFLKNYSGVHEVISFDENKGIAYARHFSERHVKTKYIVFLDSDDKPFPDLVEKLYKKIASDSDLIVVGCYLEYINQFGAKMRGGIFLGDSTKNAFYKKAASNKLMFLTAPTIYDREAAMRVGGTVISGFPEGKPRYADFCEDLDLWTRMSDLYKEGKAIVVIPEILCQFRKYTDSLSASNSCNMVLRMRHIKTNLLRRRSNREELDFNTFLKSLSSGELAEIQRYSDSASLLRKSAYLFFEKKYVQSFFNLVRLFFSNPRYVFQKIKSNLIK